MESAKKQQRTLPSLVEDILLYDILPRLPVKSLFRFKVVNSKWCSFISKDPIFIASQSRRSLEASSTIIYRGIDGLVLFSRENRRLINVPEPCLNFTGCYPDLAASTNGLICCISMPDMKFTFQLCNPVSKDLVSIPNPKGRLNVALVFDPLDSPSHYKLVCPHTISGLTSLCDETFSQVYGFEVFSSKIDLWRESNAAVRIFSNSIPRKRSVFAGGKLYWRVPVDILWFDHKEDCAGNLHSPVKEKRKMKFHVEIGECRGELRYTTITDTDIEIWIVKAKKEFEFDWVKKYNITLADILEKSVGIVICRDEMRPMPFEWEGRVLFWVKAKKKGYIFKYNVKTGELKLFYKPKEMRQVPSVTKVALCHCPNCMADKL